MSDDDLAAEVRRLRREVAALQRRVADLEERPDREGAAPATGARPPVEDETRREAATGDATTSEDDPAASTGDATPGAVGRDWERDVGIRWLGLVGGLALVVGVVFFVRLAIDAGLLGPLGRVIVGALGGLALLGAGRYAAEHQGYVRWGRIAAGVGLAVTYFSVYVAYGLETYRDAIGTPLWVVLLALTGLVAATVVLSVRDRAPVVAGEAFLLGYATAFVALEASFLLTPAYGLLLAAGLVGVAAVRPWSGLVTASVVPTYAVIGVWMNSPDHPAPAFVAGVVAVAFAIYVAGGLVLRASDRTDRRHRLQVAALTGLNAAIATPLLEVTVREWFPSLPVAGVPVAVVGLALAGVYALTARGGLRGLRGGVRPDRVAGGLAVVLVGTSVVLAADGFAATVGLLAVVCGAVAVAARADADAFRTGGHAVAGLAVFKLLVVDATDLPAVDLGAPLAAATGRASAFLLAILVFAGLAWLFQRRDAQVSLGHRTIPLAAPYAWTATGLVLVLLGLELSGASVSVAWAVFGLALVGAGLARDRQGLRLQGVAVLGVVTAKVFLYDTRGLDTLARTLSFLTLGAILLVAAYGYARAQGEDPFGRLTGE